MGVIRFIKSAYSIIEAILAWIENAFASWLVPTLARLVFAGALLGYFWASAYTKLGEGLFGFLSLSVGAYVQIFPLAMERVGYDPTDLSFFHTLVAVAGTWAEFILPDPCGPIKQKM